MFKQITIVSAVNTNGIKETVREVPKTNNSDINRMFVEDPTTDIADIKQLIKQHDVVIDIHSSPNCTEFMLLNKDEYTESYIEFCEKVGMAILISYIEKIR